MRRRPADCGMPGDGVSFQKNAGYEVDGDTGDVFPRQTVESNAFLSLWASREGWLHGRVNAFDSHEQGRSGLRKSQIATAPA